MLYAAVTLLLVLVVMVPAEKRLLTGLDGAICKLGRRKIIAE